MSESNTSEVNQILQLICSHLKLDRDKGVARLDCLVKTWTNNGPNEEVKNVIQSCILENLDGTGSESREIKWEVKHGCLMACCPLISSMDPTRDQNFLAKIQAISLEFLRDEELRLQLAAGCALACLTKLLGISVYEASRTILLDMTTLNLQTIPPSSSEELLSPEQGFDVLISANAIKDKVAREAIEWQRLEPSLKCLQFMIEHLGNDFPLDEAILNVIIPCMSHTNRYVRETGFQICSVIVVLGREELADYDLQISEKLSQGLMDHWNQVRLAALNATRGFLLTRSRDPFYPSLLPKLCLNRYYKAEGVRIYTQETWRIIAVTEGRTLVGRYISDVVNCYSSACYSDNPADREAACSCISELAQKIDETKPYAELLIDLLVSKATDPAWSVRDAACLAFGSFATHYPEESKPKVTIMYEILFENLGDPMILLRQGAGAALASIVKAYGAEAKEIVMDKLSVGLKSVEGMKQPQDPVNSTAPIDSPDLVRQSWQLTDGSLYLIGALAELPLCQSELPSLVPAMVATTTIRTYGEHFVVLETFCRILPQVAKAIGKKQFKEFLVLVFEPIFYAMESQSPATVGLGKSCIDFLSQFIGPNILRSRVEQYDSRKVHLLDPMP